MSRLERTRILLATFISHKLADFHSKSGTQREEGSFKQEIGLKFQGAGSEMLNL